MKRFVVIITIITLLIISVFTFLDIINITQYIELTNKYDWLGFYGTVLGSVIGGAITYIGVYKTIRFTKEEGEKEIAHKIRPYLDFKYITNSTTEMPMKDLKYFDREDIGETEIINYGLGTCIDIQIYRYEEKTKNFPDGILVVNRINALTINESKRIKLGMDKININDIYAKAWDYMFIYKDTLDNKYVQIVTYNISILERLENGSYAKPTVNKFKNKAYYINIEQIYEPIFFGKKELEVKTENFNEIVNKYKKTIRNKYC